MKRIIILILIFLLIIIMSFLISFLIKKKTKLNKNRHVVLFTCLITIVLTVSLSVAYLSIYSRADKSVKNFLRSDDEVNVKKISNGYFFDGAGTRDAIIFYPGAKVEYTSYAPLMYELAANGFDCFLLKMPLNMAVLGENKADKIIKNYNYESYYMAGHSFGGVAASSYASKSDKIKGVILLASYSTKTLDKETLLIYGSNDGVLNKNEYEKAKTNYKNYKEVVINGGNHAQFGMYGTQKGDKKATIGYLDQQFITVNAIIEYFKQ